MKITYLTTLLMFLSFFSFAQEYSITGKIVDETGETMPGVNVIIKGTTIGTSTDIDGQFLISTSIKKPILVIMFMGYEQQEISIKGSKSINITMQPDSKMLGEVVLTAQAEGQKNAILEQVNSNTIKNVVAQDRLQENPDANSVEAIGRLPGVSVTRSGGEGTGLVVRGLAPKYTAVTLNGVRMPGTGANGRETNISGISQYALQGVEIYKSLTADMDANSVAGTINLKLRETPMGLHYNVLAQGGYNNLNDYYSNYKLQGEVGTRFFNDKLGVFVSLSAESANRGVQTMGSGYDYQTVGDKQEFLINNTSLNNIAKTNKRQSALLTLDYKIHPTTKLGFYGMYNRSGGSNANQAKSYGAAGSGSIGYHFSYNTESVNEVFLSAISAETDLDFMKLDYGVSMSKGKANNPNDRSWNYVAKNASDLIETVLDIPTRMELKPEDVPPLYNDNKENINQFLLTNFSVTTELMTEKNLDAYLNITIPFEIGKNIKASVKTGYSYRNKKRLRDVLEGNAGAGTNYRLHDNVADDLSWIVRNPLTGAITADGMQSGYISDFLGGRYDFGPTFSFDKLNAITDSWNATSKYWYDQGEEIWGKEYSQQNIGLQTNIYSSVMSDQDITEIYHAGYLMAEFNIGKWVMFLPGVRYENTKATMNGFTSFQPTLAAPTYDDLPGSDTTAHRANNYLLPMIHLRITPVKWFYTHMAYTQTLSRPSFDQINPNSYVNTGINFIYHTKAPQLDVEEWDNFDIQFTFHGQKLGLFSVSGFYKKVNNQIWARSYTRIKGDPIIDEFPDAANVDVSIIENNTNEITLKGFELEMQTSFWYADNFLKYFTVSTNYTFTNSSTFYPTTRIEDIVTYPPGGGRPTFERIRIDSLIEGPMMLQPKHIINASLGFNRKGLNAWLSFQYNGGVLESTHPRFSELDILKKEFYRLDLQVSYKFSGTLKGFEIIGNFANLNDFVEQKIYRDEKRQLYMENYGWTVDLGARYSF